MWAVDVEVLVAICAADQTNDLRLLLPEDVALSIQDASYQGAVSSSAQKNSHDTQLLC